jgi:hypothetical protein
LLSVTYAEVQAVGLAETCRLLASYAFSDAQQEAAAIARFQALVGDPNASEAALEAAKQEMERLGAVAMGSFTRFKVVHCALRK